MSANEIVVESWERIAHRAAGRTPCVSDSCDEQGLNLAETDQNRGPRQVVKFGVFLGPVFPVFSAAFQRLFKPHLLSSNRCGPSIVRPELRGQPLANHPAKHGGRKGPQPFPWGSARPLVRAIRTLSVRMARRRGSTRPGPCRKHCDPQHVQDASQADPVGLRWLDSLWASALRRHQRLDLVPQHAVSGSNVGCSPQCELACAGRKNHGSGSP